MLIISIKRIWERKSNLKKNLLQLPHGEINLPIFIPDATSGVVRSVDIYDLDRCKIQALIMNTFHLIQRPGSSTIKTLGGLHKMSAWNKPIFTDSGGFQAFSLIRGNSKYGKIDDKGITFTASGSNRKFNLTPEKVIQLQLNYGSDVLICLDDCTHADEPLERQKQSVERTIKWAKKSKIAFNKLIKQKKINQESKPLLLAVIQGGISYELRKRCAENLLEIGFDAYGYGGWPLDKHNNLLEDVVNYTRELIPKNFPMHALGIGHPSNIVKCVKMGYDIFDCSMPTKDARKGRLYVFNEEESIKEDWFSFLYIKDEKHIKSKFPISKFCDCLTCSNYSVAYLHHLFNINEVLYQRLGTIHNLRFMTLLMERLRKLNNGV